MSSSETGRLLDVKEVAEILGVSPSWVRTRTKSGTIKHVVLGGLKKYRPADIAEYVDSLVRGG